MTSDLDIYRTAKLLIDQHGLKGASEHAAERIVTLRDRGDHEGARTWGKIRAALLDLNDVRFRDDGVH
jgi:hypothetical protein